MTIYATVDGTGRLTGFYDDALHQTIPAGALEISPELYQAWLAAQDTVVWKGMGLAPAPASAATLDARLATLDAYRRAKQAAGVMFTPTAATVPVRFATDDAALARLLGEFVVVEAGLRGGTGPWQTAAGSFVTLADADVKALYSKARSYAVACYAREQALAAALAADPTTDITSGWPSNL